VAAKYWHELQAASLTAQAAAVWAELVGKKVLRLMLCPGRHWSVGKLENHCYTKLCACKD